MDQLFAVKYSWLIPLLPLLGAGFCGLLGARLLKQRAQWPIWIGVGASAVISLSLLVHMLQLWHGGQSNLSVSKDWYTWIQAGSFNASAGFYFDALTAVMLAVVTGIGFLIMVFSAGYMAGEAGYWRFFAYMGLFIFAMTCLVMANNFVLLYLGWEGVGLCSYLLIGYYYERPSAREAAKKAFLVNRIGDFGFGLGIMLIWKVFGTVSYFGDSGNPGVLVQALNPNSAQFEALKWIPFLLMVGAFGKSAQFPLYVWLPDAMEGPTPVSALIHAATMVTAGVYMIARCSALFVGHDNALLTIAAVGAFTAIFAASIALRQFDLKKVFAYSTISQLGYMFVGVAVLAPVAGIFHLVTHACFKALLFLCSGVVMHAMAGELDMRKMSGLKKVLPWTNRFILVGCLALAGFPLLSGFFSKDDIIGAAFHRSAIVGIVLLAAAFLTAYYTFRLYFSVFQGELIVPTAPKHAVEEHPTASEPHEPHHHHEPMVMMLPLAVLTIGAIFAGYLNWPADWLGGFLQTSKSFAPAAAQVAVSAEKSAPVSLLMVLSALISISGIAMAYWLHLKDRARGVRLAEQLQPLTAILQAKYWVDEIYQAVIVEPLRSAGESLFAIDEYLIDGLVGLISYVPQFSGFALKLSLQRGYLQGYAAVMLLGLAAIMLWIFI